MKKIKNQLGATLLESLIALVVFSVGALGIAALQTTTLVRSDDVKQRSIAIWKAQELADRIKSTNSIDVPTGLSADYVTEIGNTTIASIGVLDNTNLFTCPTAAPTRCDDTAGGAAAVCDAGELVEFDVWSVFCDPATGLSSTSGGDVDGANKLKNLDVALVVDDNGTPLDVTDDEFRLYLEWLSRSTDQEDDFQGGVDVTTNLCGDDVDVDSRLGVYCLRFRT